MLFEDLVRAIRESPFFHGMSQEEQISLARLGGVDVHPPGGVLFQPGDVPSALYLVLDGVVEVSRVESNEVGLQPVAYLGVGSTLAESKIITGSVFGSHAQFPEGGVIMSWPRPILLRQLYESRDFALHYLQSLARRFEGKISNLGAHKSSNLGGKLEHFDLPAILQTVVESGASGVLEITAGDGTDFGAIHTHNKMIGQMRCGSLSGAEAFLEILNSPPAEGSFRFSNLAKPHEVGDFLPVQPFLLEAARVQDEFKHFASTVPETAYLHPSAKQLVWHGGGNSELVEQIWHQLSVEACGWGTLAEILLFSRGRVGLAVRDMLLAGVIMVHRDSDIGEYDAAQSV
jgi:CRP-like cAMP-binding protein